MQDTAEDLRRAARNARDRTRRAHDRDRLTLRERQRRDAKKRIMLASLGGRCKRCLRTVEEIGHVAAFDFHHLIPATKRYGINRIYNLRAELREEELSKCIVLCANCHRIVEATSATFVASSKGVKESVSPVLRKRRQGRPPLGSAHALQIACERMAAVIRRAEARATRRAAAQRYCLPEAHLALDLFDFTGSSKVGRSSDQDGL
jgi:hypothetical protein